MDILDKIVENKKNEVNRFKKKNPIDKSNLRPFLPVRDFKKAISKPNCINLVAEVKRFSPSAGLIRENFNFIEIAKQYEEAGASAVSVLTDEKFFQGSLSYLKQIKKQISIPVLRKDFIIDEYQVYESILNGADAILLIADILSEFKLNKYIKIAKKYNLDCLIESHTEKSLRKSLNVKAEIIGINNRNLKTFKVDIKKTHKLIKIIPDKKVIVSESGIKSHKDILYLKNLKVNAVLIGEILMKADDINAKINEIMK